MAYKPYVTVVEVTREASLQGIAAWPMLGDDDMKNVVYRASKDIEACHGELGSSPDIPWKFGDWRLRQAARFQALFRAENAEAFEAREHAGILSDDSYSDGAISINVSDETSFDKNAKSLVLQVMSSSGVEARTAGLGGAYQ